MIQGVVFDMDGVLFDSERIILLGMMDAGKKMNWNVTEEMGIESLGKNHETCRGIFHRYCGQDADYELLRRMSEAYMDDYIERNGMPLKPGVFELLDDLKERRMPVALATSSVRERVDHYFEKAGIAGYFTAVVTGDMIERGKPEPDIYLAAAKALGLPPQHLMAIEDSFAGIASAYSAGMMPVMVPDLVQPDEATEKMLYAKAETLGDVIALIEQANAPRRRP
ncbi:MAG: HAD family hydrolase [Christensenellales bacterium]|jgi:HAD superfamily hydrolase (TIGR01509 family)